MRTDKQCYEVFVANPEWLFEVIDRPSPGKCRMQSVVFKALEIRADGLIVPENEQEALTIGEFQFQLDRTIFARTVLAMTLAQIEYPEREIRGVILFGSPQHNPQIEPWHRVVDCINLPEAMNRLEL